MVLNITKMVKEAAPGNDALFCDSDMPHSGDLSSAAKDDLEETFAPEKFEQALFETTSSGSLFSDGIAFGNRFDDNTIIFLEHCKEAGIELPVSVTHNNTGIERCVDGGLTSIDKSIIKGSIDDALDNKKITQEKHDGLVKELYSC